MRLGWEWVNRENKRKNSLSTSDLVLPTTLIVIFSEKIANFIDLAVIYYLQAIVNYIY
ncbi:MAG: hypothetical protein RMX68_009865 [Aulosira sp. ZfuVER01]|nr:hypothetical protein [Aulosira sp. ZfuVER01]MDZ7998024.1 hypothetical protein [Aulosira sp. DedVER01a]MDZ8050418.1 hypothetical protein [Aulosira sp. ZfuCHP01]